MTALKIRGLVCIVLADELTSGLLDGPVSGIMGLGFEAIASTDSTPFWQALVNAGDLSSPEMSFWLARESSTSEYSYSLSILPMNRFLNTISPCSDSRFNHYCGRWHWSPRWSFYFGRNKYESILRQRRVLGHTRNTELLVAQYEWCDLLPFSTNSSTSICFRSLTFCLLQRWLCNRNLFPSDPLLNFLPLTLAQLWLVALLMRYKISTQV